MDSAARARMATLSALLAGCIAADPLDVVTVRVQVPAEISPDAYRLAKIVDGDVVVVERRSPKAAPGASELPLGVRVPRADARLEIVAQAVRGASILAEGSLRFVGLAAPAAPLVLRPCPMPLAMREAVFESCLGSAPSAPWAPDAGGDGPASPPTGGGAAGGAFAADARADGVPRAKGSCASLDAGAPPAVLPPVVVSDKCIEYCAAMQVSCNDIFESKERCEFTCAKLAWPTGGAPDDDTVDCRTAWAKSASAGDAARKCKYASPRSDDACGRSCTVYCRMGALLCPAEFPPFLECQSACNELAATVARMFGKSINPYLYCRLDQLEAAVFDRRKCAFSAPDQACSSDQCPAVVFDGR